MFQFFYESFCQKSDSSLHIFMGMGPTASITARKVPGGTCGQAGRPARCSGTSLGGIWAGDLDCGQIVM